MSARARCARAADGTSFRTMHRSWQEAELRVILWLATMLFFVAFFSYGYVLWKRSVERRAARSNDT